ncbi:MAG: peptidyl-prolyl cis-trans isomerase [Bacillota bacterium]|nr:peptidyl-prolyl cis-trans isomerase [Bacillota bacterium]MDP4169028.1 peptidyl-prolyl cis-trans isomerase [Bacillota bacterium]
MKPKQLWLVIAGLILLNCITAVIFFSKSVGVSGSGVSGEEVATIGNDSISRQSWLNELEERYGQDVLRDMIDQKVIEQMADKYKISIPKKEIDQELRMNQMMYTSNGKDKPADQKKWRQQIKSNLLLDDILTKDVVVSNKEIKTYYDRNKSLFNIPESFHLSHIVVNSMAEAKKAVKELSGGSSFRALAMERSIDEFSSNLGGDIGFVSDEDERYPAQYIKEAKKLKKGQWSKPIKTDQGYAIILLQDKVKGQTYSYQDVKNQIRRQIALDQMKTPVTARTFWDEAKVNWFYGNKKDN